MDDEIDALYDLPPGEFTGARDALVKRLRADQRRDEANTVKALRRPSTAAWAVNQVARRHADALDAVVEAGAQLATAQRRALSGIKDAGLQAAAARRREAIEHAWRLAATALAEQDAGVQPQRQAVVETLEAASVDEDAAATVRAGRLTSQLAAPSDFGAVSGFALVPPDSGADDREPDESAAGSDVADAESADARQERVRRRQRAEQAAADAKRDADDAQRRAGDARQAAVRGTAESQRLQEQAEKAAQRAAAAEREATQRVEKAEQLEAEADQAAQEAKRLAAAAQDMDAGA